MNAFQRALLSARINSFDALVVFEAVIPVKGNKSWIKSTCFIDNFLATLSFESPENFLPFNNYLMNNLEIPNFKQVLEIPTKFSIFEKF